MHFAMNRYLMSYIARNFFEEACYISASGGRGDNLENAH